MHCDLLCSVWDILKSQSKCKIHEAEKFKKKYSETLLRFT